MSGEPNFLLENTRTFKKQSVDLHALDVVIVRAQKVRERQTRLCVGELADVLSKAKTCSPSLRCGYRREMEGAREAIQAFLERSGQHTFESTSWVCKLDLWILREQVDARAADQCF